MTYCVSALRAFKDNYIWLLHSGSLSSSCIIVDPGDSQVVIDALKEKKLNLQAIFITHHHYDHTNGMVALKQKFPHCIIYGPKTLLGVDIGVEEQDKIVINSEISFEVISIPGHTLDHIAYVDKNAPTLFCGDTLFSVGCGRVFEGTAQQMVQSLAKLKALDIQTQIYCGHEYTLANIAFALTIEPNNIELQSYLMDVQSKVQANIPTLPSTLAIELAVNPFLRLDSKSVIQKIEALHNNLEKLDKETWVFSNLREMKNNF